MRIPYVDGLSFLAPDDDVQASGLTAFVWDCSSGEATTDDRGTTRFTRTFNACTRSIVEARRRLREHAGGAFLATTGSEIARAQAEGRTAVFLQFQGCDAIEEDLSRIDLFYELGLRILQFVHHGDNAFGGGCMEPTWRGLTKLGIEGLERMNELGIVPDLAHAADPTALDVVDRSTRPVVISHTGPRALVNNARCAPDEVIRRVADTGGVVGLFSMSFWVTSEEDPTLDAFVRSLRHLVDVAGIEGVGIANDYTLTGERGAIAAGNDNAQAIEPYYPWWDAMAAEGIFGFEQRPRHVVFPELNHIGRMATIHQALERAGFDDDQVASIMGGNWVRVFTETMG